MNKRMVIVFAVLFIVMTGCKMTELEDQATLEEKLAQVMTPNESKKDDIKESNKELKKEGFIEFANELAYETTIQSPLQASFTYSDLEAEGLTELLYQLDSSSIDDFDEEIAQFKEDYKRFLEYDRNALDKDERKVYDMMAFQMESGLESESYIYYSNNFNPSFGIQASVPLTLTQIELESKIEFEAFLERLTQLPILFDNVIEFEYEKAERGLLLQAYLYDLAVEQIDGLIDTPETFMIYQGYVDQVDQSDLLTDVEKKNLKTECYEIIKRDIFPSYRMLQRELKAIGKLSNNEIGTAEFDDAKAYYEWQLFDKTSYDLSVEDIEEFIQDESEVLYREIVQLMEDYPSISEKLSAGLTFGDYATMDEALSVAERLTNELFYDYGVKSATQKIIPSYLEDHLPAGFYFVTSIDGEDYGNMYLQASAYDLVDISSFSTLLHENIPGHHLYFSVLYDSDVSFAQKMGDWDSYSEGYAVHVQNYAYEELLEDPEIIAYLDLYFKLIYLGEMQDDINLHVHGASKAELTKDLLAQGASQEAIDSNYNRMLANPAEVFSYYYGYFKFEEYESAFEETMGKAYDVRVYHDFMLKHANIPFCAMDAIVEAYLKEL